MSLAVLRSRALAGMEALPVSVEVQLANGLLTVIGNLSKYMQSYSEWTRFLQPLLSIKHSYYIFVRLDGSRSHRNQ